MFLKRNKKKFLTTQTDLNSRLVQANQSLMAQMEIQQQMDTEETLKRQKAQGRILRQIMRD